MWWNLKSDLWYLFLWTRKMLAFFYVYWVCMYLLGFHPLKKDRCHTPRAGDTNRCKPTNIFSKNQALIQCKCGQGSTLLRHRSSPKLRNLSNTFDTSLAVLEEWEIINNSYIERAWNNRIGTISLYVPYWGMDSHWVTKLILRHPMYIFTDLHRT